MEYLKKSFNVSMFGNKNFADKWDRVFCHNIIDQTIDQNATHAMPDVDDIVAQVDANQIKQVTN